MAVLTEGQRVEIGSRYNGEKLVQNANTLVAQAEQDGLTFPAGFLDRVKTQILAVESMRQDQAVAKQDIPVGTAGQGESFAKLKEWVADAVEATENAYEEDPEERDRFRHSGRKIGRSVPRLLDRAVTLLPLLQSADVAAVIAPWDFDATRLAEGESLIAQLRDADQKQELAIKALPAKTRDFYLAKGNLYLDLKRIARRGRRRFAKDSARSAAYRLDLVASRRPRTTQPVDG